MDLEERVDNLREMDNHFVVVVQDFDYVCKRVWSESSTRGHKFTSCNP